MNARQLAADVLGRHEIPRWPYIPLAAPLILLAYLKLRRVI